MLGERLIFKDSGGSTLLGVEVLELPQESHQPDSAQERKLRAPDLRVAQVVDLVPAKAAIAPSCSLAVIGPLFSLKAQSSSS